jgi:hypothetical protein
VTESVRCGASPYDRRSSKPASGCGRSIESDAHVWIGAAVDDVGERDHVLFHAGCCPCTADTKAGAA